MIVEAQVTINGSRAAIWTAITDIENASEIISGVQKIEVVEKPANRLVGLKWRETRMLFGEPAAVEKWITDAAENEFYKTRAEDRGVVFLTTFRISESSGGITLTSSHDSKPQGIVARFMSIPMFLFKGVAKKAKLQDQKRLLQSFYDLPPKDKEMLYRAVEHLRWLTMLWDLEKLSPDSMPSIPEKRHIMLAYKVLQTLWFNKLPESDHQTFTVYVRDRLPDNQDPEVVNDIFDTISAELAARCKSLARPKSLTKEAKATKISLESFPYKVS